MKNRTRSTMRCIPGSKGEPHYSRSKSFNPSRKGNQTHARNDINQLPFFSISIFFIFCYVGVEIRSRMGWGVEWVCMGVGVSGQKGVKNRREDRRYQTILFWFSPMTWKNFCSDQTPVRLVIMLAGRRFIFSSHFSSIPRQKEEKKEEEEKEE